MFGRYVAAILLSLIMASASANLDDDFVYSSKLGLLTESVATSWTSQENGLSIGGSLRGTPRDTWHTLYHYNGKLSSVSMGYALEPLVFESEKAYRRWTIEALNLLAEKAEGKYGPPDFNSLECPLSEPFNVCEGSIIWRGTNKVFHLRADNITLDSYRETYYGLKRIIRMTFGYGTLRDYDMMTARLPFLIEQTYDRNLRVVRRELLKILEPILKRERVSLEEYLKTSVRFNSLAKIQEILRKTSLTYVGGVKANYEPKRWIRSFRLQ